MLYIMHLLCLYFYSVPATAIYVVFFPANFGVLGNKQLRQKEDEKKVYANRQIELELRNSVV